MWLQSRFIGIAITAIFFVLNSKYLWRQKALQKIPISTCHSSVIKRYLPVCWKTALIHFLILSCCLQSMVATEFWVRILLHCRIIYKELNIVWWFNNKSFNLICISDIDECVSHSYLMILIIKMQILIVSRGQTV